MANLKSDIKKWMRGELVGLIATVFCGAVLAYFIICFTIARVQELKTLELVTLITAPVLMTAGAAVAAYCNLKFGGAVDKAVKNYVLDVCLENASLFHPERNSLTFYLGLQENTVELQVNGYKEKIVFDFSEMGKLSLSHKLTVLTAIENRLCITFCRLYERGASYTDVSYVERAGSRKKSEKATLIIKDGAPDKYAYKQYLKNK